MAQLRGFSMQNYKDNQLVNNENSIMTLSAISVIGDRDSQQDSFGYSLKSNEGIVVVCDGMGGHKGGKAASSIAVEKFVSDYEANVSAEDPWQALIRTAKESDAVISGLRDDSGRVLNAGSTCVAIIVKNDKLFWCSVGDSRAYLLRGEEFVQLTQDQNYGTVLNEQLKSGIIDRERYERESVHSEALISYLGMGNLSLIDYNNTPLKLESKDKIVIMSDGLYKQVPLEDIRRVIVNFKDSGEALRALDTKTEKAARRKEKSRDNMTVAIISVK